MQNTLAIRGADQLARTSPPLFWRWTRALGAAAASSAAIAWIALGLVLHAADNLILTQRSHLNELADLHA